MNHDVIVIGARCAGSPTAMLLARAGHKVLCVDSGTFPSDTLSTHLIHPPGVAALAKWGLLDRLLATGCPPIDTYAFDFGPFALSGRPGTAEFPLAYAPRRTTLDKLLVDAAVEAGVEVRESYTVERLIVDNGRVTGVQGNAGSEHARFVVGADGRQSLVARTVVPEQYHQRPPLCCAYYSYWSGLPMDGRSEFYVRPERAFAAWPTQDDLTLVIGGWPFAQLADHKSDIEGTLMKAFELAPPFAERIRAAKRETRFMGAAVPNYFRKPYGPGWALVGDAGYNKDFITAQGIQDAFRDAELCATALDDTFSGRASFDDAMARYQRTRDAALPMYEFTCEFAMLAPPPPALQQVLLAMRGNQAAMDGFARVNAGVESPAEFFSERNVTQILAHAAAS
uniref:Oxidoreductase n=1 Tax=uncultured bacterium 14 TaxID=1748267 RepID=A0A0U3SUZ6_9BACT|nr:oxidoreductase [uncultured bacterium 14]